MSDAPVAKVYHFPSQSKPGKFHEVLERRDGFLSCGCPVWIFNRRKTEPRSCSHTDQVRAGLVQPNVVHSQTDADRNARRNAPAVSRVDDRDSDGNYTSPREQEVMGRRRVRGQEHVNGVKSLVDQTREEANAKKLERVKERVSKEGMDVFPTKRKVNW
ncbi:MAG: hypothetical protein IMZ61_09125 [Planctomycetes bacterium]|nr:hypothetical protein [Planctomycetota bacterium]